MRTLLVALGALALVGCNTIKPAGIFGKSAPAPKSPPAPAKGVDPAPPPAVRPTPPTAFVNPGDVSATNPHEAADKLTSELSIDSKPTATGPVTVEVSRVKRQR